MTWKTAQEYAGPCPFCGGTDRFCVWPSSGRYWCRQCNKKGDAIDYLRAKRGISYQAACKIVVTNVDLRGIKKAPVKIKDFKASKIPPFKWMDSAEHFLDRPLSQLQSSKVWSWLRNRGLREASIVRSAMTWNPKDIYSPKAGWGLQPEHKNLWIPEGLVIPCFDGWGVARLRIRRPANANGPKYIIVSGSSSLPMMWGTEAKTFIIIESELDGMLIFQEAGDLVGIIALGTAQAKPAKKINSILDRSKRILISLDSDDAGVKATEWWMKNYHQAKRWPVPMGKDPGEAYKKGMDIREWIKDGLFSVPVKKETKKVFNYDAEMTRAIDDLNNKDVNYPDDIKIRRESKILEADLTLYATENKTSRFVETLDKWERLFLG